jgi:NAD(P)-dependent dehydrogenase (short-subunit alcohol dehydrogenase family)
MMRLQNKVAIVTGSGSGIGKAIAEGFANEGAKVAIADLNLQAAGKTAGQIGSSAIPVRVDVGDMDSAKAMVKQVEADLGPVDILVNNAGVSYITPFHECSEELWDKTIRINLKGAFNCSRGVINDMLARKSGVILNMSSQSGKSGNSQYTAYCASKFAIIGLTQSLAVEYAGSGIRVNALCPGVVFTPLWDKMVVDYAKKRDMKPEDVKPYFESKIPMGRLCTEEDVTKAAIFLSSEEASYITGQAINLSGGTIMH